MALILKVDFNGDVRRFRLELPENADIATKWTMIIEEIRAGCKLAAGDDGFVLKYTDEEGDECTLVKETLSDCLLQAGAGPVRLVSHRHAVPAGEASPAGVPGELDLMASKMIMDFKKIMKACKGKGKGNGKCGWKRHWWPQEGTVEAGKCPYGHGLSKQSLCGVCDKCDTGFSFEDVAMGCRMCNWDLCESCFKEQDPAEETAKDQDANRDAKEASAEAPGISDSEWTAEPPMDSWEAALFTHLHGKGKGKGKGKSKGKGKWGKGMCGKGHGKRGMGWGGPHWGEGHHEDHHFDFAAFWQNLAAMGQACAAQPEMSHWAQHMHEHMGAAAGQPVDPMAFFAQSPWGQMLKQWFQAAEDANKAAEQASEDKQKDQ